MKKIKYLVVLFCAVSLSFLSSCLEADDDWVANPKIQMTEHGELEEINEEP